MADHIRVIFSTGSLHVLDTARCFELAAETGFDGIEIMCDDRWSTRDPVYLKHLSERTGLPVLAVHTPFSDSVHGWPGGAADQLGLILRSLELAETLEAETLVVHLPQKVGRVIVAVNGRKMMLPWGNPFRPVRDWMADGGLAEVQQRTRVRIAIENMPVKRALLGMVNPCWWNTLGEWSRVHRHLTLDTTHWATHGIGPLEAYHAAEGRVVHVHLSNYSGGEHCLPHRGEIDLRAFLQTLAADRFDGLVCLELHPEALEFTAAEALRRNLKESLAFCREALQPV